MNGVEWALPFVGILAMMAMSGAFSLDDYVGFIRGGKPEPPPEPQPLSGKSRADAMDDMVKSSKLNSRQVAEAADESGPVAYREGDPGYFGQMTAGALSTAAQNMQESPASSIMDYNPTYWGYDLGMKAADYLVPDAVAKIPYVGAPAKGLLEFGGGLYLGSKATNLGGRAIGAAAEHFLPTWRVTQPISDAAVKNLTRWGVLGMDTAKTKAPTALTNALVRGNGNVANWARSALSHIPGFGKTVSTTTRMAGTTAVRDAAGKIIGHTNITPLGVAAKAIDRGLGYAAVGMNTIKNVWNAGTGKTYEEDAENIQRDLGPDASVRQAFLHSLMRNAGRTGMQTAGAIAALNGQGWLASMVGGALPIDHIIGLGAEGIRTAANLFSARGRQENHYMNRLLRSHFKNGFWNGWGKLFSSGYFERDQDKEFLKMQDEINRSGDQRLAEIRDITNQNRDLLTRFRAGDAAAGRELNRIRNAEAKTKVRAD